MSVPISLLAMSASAAGLLFEGTYAAETPSWAAQAVGQDAVNLFIAYPALLALAWAAGRGSLRAYLAWLGILIYSSYSYVLYAGYLNFSAWFLVYIAVLGLSVYALLGGIAVIDPSRVRDRLESKVSVRLASGWLLLFGVLFYLLELSETVRAALAGSPLQSAVDAGLPTNPVYVLDMALLLPAVLITGLLLLRRRSLGYFLAAPLLCWAVVMGLAVVVMLLVTADRVESVPVMLAAGFVVITLVHFFVLYRVLGAKPPASALSEVLRNHRSGDVDPRQ